MQYLWAFLVGGALCAIGQLLIDLTKLTPARILVAYVVSGVILGAVGLYQPLVDFAGHRSGQGSNRYSRTDAHRKMPINTA